MYIIGIFLIFKYFYKFVESMTQYDKLYLCWYVIIALTSTKNRKTGGFGEAR